MGYQQERLELTIEWFAGFFEAEGWVSLMKTHRMYKGKKRIMFVPVCGMCNTDFKILEGIKQLLEKYSIIYQLHLRGKRKKSHKESWQINMQAYERAMRFLEWIIPYMRSEKKEKAEKILEFCKTRKLKTCSGWDGVPYSEEDYKLYEEISSKILNDYTPNAER